MTSLYIIVPMWHSQPIPAAPLFFSHNETKAIRIAKSWNAALHLKRIIYAGRCMALAEQPEEYCVCAATVPVTTGPYYISRSDFSIRTHVRQTLPKHANDPYVRITLDRIYPNSIFAT